MKLSNTFLSTAAAVATVFVVSSADAALSGVEYSIYIDGNKVNSGSGGLVGSAPGSVGDDFVGMTWVAEADPTIHMGATVIDGGAASTFSIVATLFFAPDQNPYKYDLSGSVSLTDGTPENGIAIAPSAYAGIFTGLKNDYVVASIGGASPVFGPGGSHVWGPFQQTGADCPPPGVACESMTFVFDLVGTGSGDVYGLTGSFINKPSPVPVPAALPLMVSAIAAVGLLGARRKA